tara:strand:+ start:431 stop:991 length:561 start_codon:yes stop_codon:yes gene_type:complete
MKKIAAYRNYRILKKLAVDNNDLEAALNEDFDLKSKAQSLIESVESAVKRAGSTAFLNPFGSNSRVFNIDENGTVSIKLFTIIPEGPVRRVTSEQIRAAVDWNKKNAPWAFPNMNDRQIYDKVKQLSVASGEPHRYPSEQQLKDDAEYNLKNNPGGGPANDTLNDWINWQRDEAARTGYSSRWNGN